MKMIKKSLLLIGRNFYLYEFFLMFILINQLAIDFIDCYLILLFLEPGPGRGRGTMLPAWVSSWWPQYPSSCLLIAIL